MKLLVSLVSGTSLLAFVQLGQAIYLEPREFVEVRVASAPSPISDKLQSFPRDHGSPPSRIQPCIEINPKNPMALCMSNSDLTVDPKDLSFAQEQLRYWCDNGDVIKANAFMSNHSGTAAVNICNQQDEDMGCTSKMVINAFKGIDCGDDKVPKLESIHYWPKYQITIGDARMGLNWRMNKGGETYPNRETWDPPDVIW